ncbi:MAG: SusC/RagA family TonB-linked outer membrane protein, partial [Bacteroidota bacterium]
MKTYEVILVTIILLFQLSTHAQSSQMVLGTVVDAENQPLPGASVIVKNTDRGILTDFEGNFQIPMNRGDVLEVSYLGFKTQEVLFNGQENLVIRLEEDLTRLEEVVVVGYGEQRKADVTGAISSVTSEDITEQPALTAMQSIQGRAAGVQITPSAAPGTAPIVYIRGLGTAFGGRDPLYVVDGILTSDINNINPNDILKIDVLKDASSLAVYGNRGANGVIMITTRKGRAEKLKVNYDSWMGFRSVLQKVEMADARSYAIYSNESLNTERFSLDQPVSTDWFDEITRTGLFFNHNISVSGGSENVTGFFSAGYFSEEGILRDNDFNRLTLRSNTDFRISDKLKFSQQLSAALASAIPKPFSAFTNAYKQAPIVPVRYPGGPFEGKFGVSSDEEGSFNNVGNPVRDLFYNDQKIKDLRLQATFTLDYQPWEWLTYTGRFGIETAYARQYTFVPNRELFLSGDPTRTLEDYNTEVNPINTLTVRKSDNYRWVFDNFITLKRSFDNIHNFTLTLGMTAEELGGEFLEGVRENVPPGSDFFSLNNGDAGTDQTSSLKSTPVRLNSYFARLNYDFSRKYLLTATIRRDGSSQFQEGKRYGNFYAVGVGWVLSQEDFLQESAISNLKLRASYGELGNQNVPLNLIIF